MYIYAIKSRIQVITSTRDFIEEEFTDKFFINKALAEQHITDNAEMIEYNFYGFDEGNGTELLPNLFIEEIKVLE